MWQVLLAAAIAGSSGLAAKRFFSNPFSPLSHDPENHAEVQEPLTPPVRIGFLASPYDKTGGVFRFSSSGSSGETAGSRSGSLSVPRKSSRVKSRVRVRRLKKKKGFRGDEIEKGSGDGGVKASVCLKKPRTGKKNNAAASKCLSCSNDQDGSLFSWGLGVGIMYMMSTGKSEVGELNAAMEETSKVVQELKDELSRRKSLRNLQVPGSAYGFNANSMKTNGKSGQIDLNRSGMGSGGSHDVKSLGFPLSDDVEYASSVLTEEPEPEPEVVEMDRLQIELESELQKLNLTEPDELLEGFNGLVDGPEPYQCGGVSASELDKKLSRLLIEQQESQIEELEAELQTAQSKLQQKETELQMLKDCVRRLTDFSLSTSLDDEPDQNQDQDLLKSWYQQNYTDHEARKPVVGMKRPNESSLHVQERTKTRDHQTLLDSVCTRVSTG